MKIPLTTAPDEKDTTAILLVAAALFTRADVAACFPDTGTGPDGGPRRRGRPHTYAPYRPVTILCTLFFLAYTGRPATTAEALAHLFDTDGFTDDQMAIIDAADLRPTGNRGHAVRTNPGIRADEYLRLRRRSRAILAHLDDTPIGLRTRPDRDTLAAVRTARQTELADRTTAREHAGNQIIAASVPEWFAALWTGDLAVDETLVPVSTTETFADDGTTCTTPLAHPTLLSKIYRNAHAVNVTLAVAASHPHKHKNPSLVLGYAISPVAGHPAEPALVATDAADRFRQPDTAGRHDNVIVDMAYPADDTLNDELLRRHRNMICNIPRNWTRTRGLAPLKRTDIAGPTLHNGRIFCPALSLDYLARHPLHRLPHDAEPHQLALRDAQLRHLQAAIMPTNGRPIRALDRGRGRPGHAARTPKTVYKQKVYCPAAVGEAQCALKPGSHHNTTKPVILTAAEAAIRLTPAPSICRTTASTVTMTASDFKQYTHILRGSFLHYDYLNPNRSMNERTNGDLKSRDRHAGKLVKGSIRARSNPEVAILLAIYIAALNIKKAAAYSQTCHNDHNGEPPPHRRAAVKHARDIAIRRHNDRRRNPQSP